MVNRKYKVGAIVLAAGESLRMGQQKMVLPWKETTVIGQVINVLIQGNLDEIVVVMGTSKDIVEKVLRGYQIRTVLNVNSVEGEMLSSVQVGLSELSSNIEAALITLGDQPFIEIDVVRSILDTYQTSKHSLVVPSYKMRRGHPWLVDKSLWGEILKLDSQHSLRDFLNINQAMVKYVEVETDSIFLDLDTPDDYHKYRVDQK